ncbi:MAG: sensor histidine kinase [Alphaproteobacteria bacterium]|nr:sensor histidine kinase [Alphaproteobacteria bacterium]
MTAPDPPLPAAARAAPFRWVWLVFAPGFFWPWLAAPPTPPAAIGAVAGTIVYVALYLAHPRLSVRGQWIAVAAVAALSVLMAFTGGVWPLVAVYAAAMAGETRPTSRARPVTLALAAMVGGVGLAFGLPAFVWAAGAFFVVMVGFENASRTAMQDRIVELAAARDEVRRLAAAAERERIGRDLHDLLGRTLTLAALKADLASRLVRRDPDRADQEMRDVAAAARGALTEVRAAVSGMVGASFAREIEAARAALTAAGVALDVDAPDDAAHASLDGVLAMALRETVTNVVRHAGARRCSITLRREGDGVDLSVSDDGDGADIREGSGLTGLRARIAAVGGAVSIKGDARGATVRIRVPLPAMAP